MVTLFINLNVFSDVERRSHLSELVSRSEEYSNYCQKY